jgi:hypothetical protein
MREPQAYVRNGHFSKSGIAAHKELSKQPVDFKRPKILTNICGKNPNQVAESLLTRESKAIRLYKTGLGGTGFNKDNGNQVTTNHWDPLLTIIRRNLKDDVTAVKHL